MRSFETDSFESDFIDLMEIRNKCDGNANWMQIVIVKEKNADRHWFWNRIAGCDNVCQDHRSHLVLIS
jgi:hypothetical protein